MVAPGDVERVELDRAEPIEDPNDAAGFRGQRTRRRQQVGGWAVGMTADSSGGASQDMA